MANIRGSNKRKGSNAERMYAKVFREDLGYTFCKTSRQTNRMLDDAGIDLDFLPFNVQIKAGYNGGINEFKVLGLIDERLPLLFPPHHAVHKQPNILIHKKDREEGRRRNEYDELVFIWADDFSTLFPNSSLKGSPIPIKTGQKRGWSFEEILTTNLAGVMWYQNEDKTLLVMSFEKFKKFIKE
jgi:hypothetical protein